MTNDIKKIIIYIVIIAIIGYAAFYIYNAPKINKEDIISRDGIHWHPNLKITIKGEGYTIPGGIGLTGISMAGIHTHEENDKLHLEKTNIVIKDDIRIKNFFKIWGKTFNSNCILDKCNGPDGKVKLIVNGKENQEFENYLMQDNDKIEIIFE